MDRTTTEYRLSQSALSCYMQCPRKFFYEKIKRRVPQETSKSLIIGKAVHAGLEYYFRNLGHFRNLGSDGVFRQLADSMCEAAMLSMPVGCTEEDRIKVKVMLEQYAQTYMVCDSEQFEVLEVESWFDKPLLDKDFRMYGVVDAIVRMKSGGVYIIEHKTASSVDDYYVEHIEIDSQVSSYLFGFNEKYDIKGIIYDVIRKPKASMKVSETDAEYEARKAASKTGRIKRKEAEDPDEYAQRVSDEMYDAFKRIILPVNWSNSDKSDGFGKVQYGDSICDLAFQAIQIRDSLRNDIFPKHTCNCRTMYGVCPYFRVCTLRDSLDSENFSDYDSPKMEENNE